MFNLPPEVLPLDQWLPPRTAPAEHSQQRNSTLSLQDVQGRSGNTASTMQMPNMQVARGFLQTNRTILRKSFGVSIQDMAPQGEMDMVLATPGRLSIGTKVLTFYPRPLHLDAYPKTGRQYLETVHTAGKVIYESPMDAWRRLGRLMTIIESWSERRVWVLWFCLVQLENTTNTEQLEDLWKAYCAAYPPLEWGFSGGYLGVSPGRPRARHEIENQEDSDDVNAPGPSGNQPRNVSAPGTTRTRVGSATFSSIPDHLTAKAAAVAATIKVPCPPKNQVPVEEWDAEGKYAVAITQFHTWFEVNRPYMQNMSEEQFQTMLWGYLSTMEMDTFLGSDYNKVVNAYYLCLKEEMCLPTVQEFWNEFSSEGARAAAFLDSMMEQAKIQEETAVPAKAAGKKGKGKGMNVFSTKGLEQARAFNEYNKAPSSAPDDPTNVWDVCGRMAMLKKTPAEIWQMCQMLSAGAPKPPAGVKGKSEKQEKAKKSFEESVKKLTKAGAFHEESQLESNMFPRDDLEEVMFPTYDAGVHGSKRGKKLRPKKNADEEDEEAGTATGKTNKRGTNKLISPVEAPDKKKPVFKSGKKGMKQATSEQLEEELFGTDYETGVEATPFVSTSSSSADRGAKQFKPYVAGPGERLKKFPGFVYKPAKESAQSVKEQEAAEEEESRGFRAQMEKGTKSTSAGSPEASVGAAELGGRVPTRVHDVDPDDYTDEEEDDEDWDPERYGRFLEERQDKDETYDPKIHGGAISGSSCSESYEEDINEKEGRDEYEDEDEDEIDASAEGKPVEPKEEEKE
eukprot:g9915.t1